LIKNSQPFGKNCQKTALGDFFDSHCTSVPVNTWMGDHLQVGTTGKPTWYVISHLGQLSLSSLQVG